MGPETKRRIRGSALRRRALKRVPRSPAAGAIVTSSRSAEVAGRDGSSRSAGRGRTAVSRTIDRVDGVWRGPGNADVNRLVPPLELEAGFSEAIRNAPAGSRSDMGDDQPAVDGHFIDVEI